MSQADEPAAPAPPADTPGRGRKRTRRKLIATVAIIGVCLGVVVTRAVWAGRTALSDGDAAHASGDQREAIARWRRAARWYVPLAPHVADAYQRLEKLGAEAERQGDIDTALMAWRGVRGSILATRSFFTPHSERLDPANRRIAALMARQEANSEDENRPLAPSISNDAGDDAGDGAVGSEVGSESWHYQLLARETGPSVLWSIIALLGFAMWVGGGFLFALRGVTADDQLVPRTAAYAGILIMVGLLVWMLGLYLA